MAKEKVKKSKISTTIKKIPFGIRGFDVISEGGIPKGRTTLLSGTSGSRKDPFCR